MKPSASWSGRAFDPATETFLRLRDFVFWGRSDARVHEKYELGQEIGQGSFGVVRLAKVGRGGGA